MRQITFVSLVVLFSLTSTARADGRAWKIYEQTVRATAWVRGARSGTGWLIDVPNKLVVTSLRHVGKDKSVMVVFAEFQENSLIGAREHMKKAKSIAGHVLARDGKRDLALIQLESLPDSVTALKLARESPSAGDRLHAVTNTSASHGLWSYSTGVVRQIYRRKDQLGGASFDARAIVCQMPINAGDNGAPVVNDVGELVGVATSSVDNARLVTYCVDVSEVRDCVSKYISKNKAAKNADQKTSPSSAGDTPRLNGEDVFQKVLPGTLWVVGSDAKKPAGTGCLVDRKRKIALTALHVIAKDDAVKVWFPVYEAGKLIGKRDHYYKTVAPIRARVLHKMPGRGLAVLELESVPASAVELKLAAVSARPTDEVCVIGNNLFGTGLWVYHTGVVRQSFPCQDRVKDTDWQGRVLETQTPFNVGDAGGPVVNGRGELVGIVDMGMPGTKYVTYCSDVAEIRAALKVVQKNEEK